MYEKEPLQPGSWLAQADKDEIAVTQHGDTYVPLKKDYYLEETERPGEFMQIDEDENGTYLMNARDLCAIEHLDALVNAGVNSLKVEGRSKSVYYAAVIARAYRRALSDMANGNPFDDNNLSEVFSTSHRGLITGFLFGNPGRSAQKFDKAKPENSTHRFSGIVHEYDAEKGWIKVEPRNPIRKGMTLELLKPTSTTELVISELYNTEFDPIDAIHGGLHFCYIPIQDDPGEFALLREKLI